MRFLKVRFIKVGIILQVVSLLFSCWGKEGRPVGTDGPLLIIGVDGMSWEVLRALMEGKRYPLIKWSSPQELASFENWTTFPLAEGSKGSEIKGIWKEGILVLDREASPEVHGVALAFPLKENSFNRYYIELEARSLQEEGGVVTLHVGFHHRTNHPRLSGNNSTLWRSEDLGPEWKKVRLEVQPPVTADKMVLSIIPYPVTKDALPPPPPPSLPLARQRIQVRSPRMSAGKILSFPSPEDLAHLAPERSLVPNLTRLVKQGSYGPMMTIVPSISPLIWTSIITGEAPNKHGITNFTVPAPGKVRGAVLATSSARKVPAIWNILTDYGDKSSGVVSWWATWPAETIRGFIVSAYANDYAIALERDKNYFPKGEGVARVYQEFATYPGNLLSEIEPSCQDPARLTREQLSLIISRLDDATWERFSKIEKVSKQDRLSSLKFIYAKDISTVQISLYLFKKKKPNLLLSFFSGVDGMSHLYWHCMDPEIYPPVSKEEVSRFGGVVENYYRFIDEKIGELLKAAGPEARVFIISDHGFYPQDFMLTRKDGPTGGHTEATKAVMIAAGPGVKKGHLTLAARVFDIMPTALYLLGYPVAEDIEGEVMMDILDPEWVKTHPGKSVSHYQYLSNHIPENVPVNSRFDDEITERLKALGYLQ